MIVHPSPLRIRAISIHTERMKEDLGLRSVGHLEVLLEDGGISKLMQVKCQRFRV